MHTLQLHLLEKQSTGSVCASMLSCFSQIQLFATLWTISTRLFCPWDSPGKNTGVGCRALLQGIFLTQGLNLSLLCLLHFRQFPYCWVTREILQGPFSSFQFSCSVVSNSLWPHGLQHVRLPCLSPIPRVCSHSCALSQWCHPTISSSVVPFSSCLQGQEGLFPASGSFPVSQFF